MNSDPGSMQPLIGHILLVIFLTFIHACFAASEIAFVSLNQDQLLKDSLEGNRRAKRVIRLLDESDELLSSIQIVLTTVSLFNSALVAYYFTDYIANQIKGFPFNQLVSILIITLIISYFILIFGEQLPKSLAIQNPDKIALMMSGFIQLTRKVLKPLNWGLNLFLETIKKVIPIDFDKNDENMTRDEFRFFLEESHNHEVIDPEEFSMLKGVLSLDNKIAREVMVPRTDAFMLDYEDSNRENIEALLDTPYSRVPLYYEDKDNILGIVHVKNLLQASKQISVFKVDLKSILNEALFVPGTIYIDDLILQMKRTKNQMAILNDEYGGVVGIVTLEDLLEEIVGEIDDEYDETSDLIEQLGTSTYIIEGGTPLDKFNDYFNADLVAEDVDTVAGFFITNYGNIPSNGENATIETDKHIFNVESVEGTRIVTLVVTIKDE